MAASQAAAMLAAIFAALLDSVLDSEAAIADIQAGMIVAMFDYSISLHNDKKRMRTQ